MKYTHFDDIEPNNKTDFIMLYFAACRSLQELEAAIRRTNGGKLTCRQAWLLAAFSANYFKWQLCGKSVITIDCDRLFFTHTKH